jgi:hypothetical protein
MKVVSSKKLRDLDAMAATLAKFNQTGAELIAKLSVSEVSLKAALTKISELETRVAVLEAQQGGRGEKQ